MNYLEKYKKGELVENQPQNGMQINKGNANGGKDDKDEEKGKLKGQLSEAIVTDKPNVKWTDIAG
jgi:vacuolar protein-sorting-associated protein 4